jgi:hypothetical protein
MGIFIMTYILFLLIRHCLPLSPSNPQPLKILSVNTKMPASAPLPGGHLLNFQNGRQHLLLNNFPFIKDQKYLLHLMLEGQNNLGIMYFLWSSMSLFCCCGVPPHVKNTALDAYANTYRIDTVSTSGYALRGV